MKTTDRINRKRFLALVAGLLCASAAAGGATGATTAPQRLAVLSYNIRHGEGTDGRIDLERIAGVIRSVSPDLVALQEVDCKTSRSGGVDQAAELARLTALTMVFGRTIDYQGGLYGNAVLSRLAIKKVENHALPFTPGREPRAVLSVEVAWPPNATSGTALVFLATHFDYSLDSTDRMAAVAVIAKRVEAAGRRPMLLAGDLNAVAESPPLKTLGALWQIAGAGKDLPTSPSPKPRRQIDYVLYRPADRWRVVEVRVLSEPIASDHRPILAVLELLDIGSRNRQTGQEIRRE